jgi:Nucleotidyltransferase domain
VGRWGSPCVACASKVGSSIGAAMNAETEHLRALARRVVAAAVDCVSVRAALLAGSAGRGNADRFSDIDLLLYVDQVPSVEVFAQIRQAVGGTDPLRRHEPTDHFDGEEFTLDGVRTELSFTTVERVEWQLDQLLNELEEVVSPHQKFLSGLHEGMPLHGAELVAVWQTRVRSYPEPLRRMMIVRHWDFFPLWYYGEAMAVRDSELWRIDMLLDGAFKLLGVLAGLNRVYFARFELKRMRELVAKMPLAPPSLSERIESLFRLPPEAAAGGFAALVEETREIVAAEFPDLDLPLPFPAEARQQPWSFEGVE